MLKIYYIIINNIKPIKVYKNRLFKKYRKPSYPVGASSQREFTPMFMQHFTYEHQADALSVIFS